uniref:Uncharacterized protein n=1 Tax=Anguilla anguilla TaxID=7936 RepID=A0A0E9TX59_ANGAN
MFQCLLNLRTVVQTRQKCSFLNSPVL